jgi:nucleotidyltransferase substrate binding protein (TIGR01987 family)
MHEASHRWYTRHDHYRQALQQLVEACRLLDGREISRVEKAGVIKTFEFAWELGWKVMRDYLQVQGIQIETITPASVIRAAFSTQVILDGDGWMAALDARNQTSHTYDAAAVNQMLKQIRSEFLPLFESLESFLASQRQT